MKIQINYSTFKKLDNLFSIKLIKHIINVFKEGELSQDSTVAKFATVQKEGGRQISRELEYYNLDVIISVGYRVKSKRGTQFRIWANTVLKDYLVKGYALNENRLKEQTQQKILERTPLRRAGSPEDVARAVAFFASDAPYVTGQILAVDGGRSLGW